MQWVLGYVSGVEIWTSTSDSADLLADDANVVWGWLDKYCGDNPSTKLSVALDHLLEEARTAR